MFTADGRTDRFVVAEIVGREIISKTGGRYDRDEVVKLERKSLSIAKTLLLGVGIYAGVGLVVVLLAASSYGAL